MYMLVQLPTIIAGCSLLLAAGLASAAGTAPADYVPRDLLQMIKDSGRGKIIFEGAA